MTQAAYSGCGQDLLPSLGLGMGFCGDWHDPNHLCPTYLARKRGQPIAQRKNTHSSFLSTPSVILAPTDHSNLSTNAY